MVAKTWINGYRAYYDEERKRWVQTGEKCRTSTYQEGEVRSFYRPEDLPCPRCGEGRLDGGEDACLGHLPGVKYACCGHGQEEGYITFENGVTIRGWFEVEPPIEKYGNIVYEDWPKNVMIKYYKEHYYSKRR